MRALPLLCLQLLACRTEHPGDTRGFLADAAASGGPPRDAARADAARADARAVVPDAAPDDAGAPMADGPRADGAAPDAAVVDEDGDGLDDALEARLALAYLPFISIDPTDGCPRVGAVFRARPHPADPALVNVIYVLLFERDCGLGGHVGDDEAFGITIDPRAAAPAGLTALRTASHQGTICERVSECGSCAGLEPCDLLPRGGVTTPTLFVSKDKHGSYARRAACGLLATCLDTCADAPAPTTPVLVNVGEPGAPLVRNLTAQGFIRPEDGWTETALHDYDPWGGADFGGAGSVAGDLDDRTFVPAACAGPGVPP